jgi:formate--tetrahydrofolate ligase
MFTLYEFTEVCQGLLATVRNVINAGAEFLMPITGNILSMPGLPKHPAAERIDIDDEGNISGLF